MIHTETDTLREGSSSTVGRPGSTSDRSGDAKAQLKAAGHDAAETAKDAGQQLKEAGREAVHQATAAARETQHQAREKASQYLASRKEDLAGEVRVFGDALHRAAEGLREGDDQTLCGYTEQAAAACDSAADYLRDADGRRLFRDTSSLTRRHPELVLGGLFLVGLSAARFLKASRHHDEDGQRNRNFGRTDNRFRRNPAPGAYGMLTPAQQDAQASAAGLNRSRTETFSAPELPSETPSLVRNPDLTPTIAPQAGSYPPTGTTPGMAGSSATVSTTKPR